MTQRSGKISPKDIDAWTKRLETEWTCAQFASSLQVTPELASAILQKNGETLSSFAKARMILSVLLVKRRVVSDVTPLESFLKELNTETDEWIKVLLACSDEKRIGGGPLRLDDEGGVPSKSIGAAIDFVRELGKKEPKCTSLSDNWEVLFPLSAKAFEKLEDQVKTVHFKLK